MAAVTLIAVALVSWALTRQARLRRQQWLRNLALAGTWECMVGERILYLDLRGGPGSGDYEERNAHGGQLIEKGVWEIRGYGIRFHAVEGEPIACELRAFGDGSIGIDGGDRVRRIYERRNSNVIPMRRRN